MPTIDDIIFKVSNYPQSELLNRQLQLVYSTPLFDIEASSFCNVQCEFCPRKKIEQNKMGNMSITTMNMLIEWLPKKASVIISGLGEPLLNPDIDFLVSHLRKKNIPVCLITNGTLLNEECVRKLIGAGINEIQISIPSIKQKKYQAIMEGADLNVVLENIHELKKNAPQELDIRLNIVMYQENKDEIIELIRYAESMEISPYIRRFHSRGGMKHHEFRTDFNACGIFSSVTFVSWDGNILPCANNANRAVFLGNLKNTSFEDIKREKINKILSSKLFSNCGMCDDDYRWLILENKDVHNKILINDELYGIMEQQSLDEKYHENFRDVGESTGSQEPVLLKGRLFRSGQIVALSELELKHKIEFLGLRTLIDFRTKEEIRRYRQYPDLLRLGIKYINLPLKCEGIVIDKSIKISRGYDGYEYLYYHLLKHEKDNIRQFFEILADEKNHPVLLHCIAGKDRTGIIVALLLLTLGVPEKNIILDYTKTPRVEEKNIHHLFKLVAEYGGIEGYLDYIEFSTNKRETLKRSLLQDG